MLLYKAEHEAEQKANIIYFLFKIPTDKKRKLRAYKLSTPSYWIFIKW